VEYDASDGTATGKDRYTASRRRVQLQNARTWQTNDFALEEARFRNSQQGADFRLRLSQPDLYIRRVTVIFQ
jgi:hypothetical protein